MSEEKKPNFKCILRRIFKDRAIEFSVEEKVDLDTFLNEIELYSGFIKGRHKTYRLWELKNYRDEILKIYK